MAMSCCLKWQAGSKSDVGSSRIGSRTTTSSKQQRVNPANKPMNRRRSNYVLDRLDPEELNRLLKQALRLLPEPIVKRNPTLSNPFVRIKVYELACGEP